MKPMIGSHAFKGKAIWLAALLTMVLLAGCADDTDDTADAGDDEATETDNGETDNETGSDGSEPELDEITVGLPVMTSTFVPLFIASDEGYFEEEGVEVEVVAFSGGTDLVRSIVGGSAQIGITGLSGILPALQQGQDLSTFYGGYNMPLYEIWGEEDIESLSDAEGAAFGVTSAGSSTDVLTRYMLMESGLDPDSDVEIIESGGSAERIAAMDSGQLQANIFAPPENFIAEERGYHLLESLSELVEQFPTHMSVATTEFLDSNPNTVEAFLRGMVKGIRHAEDNPEDAAQAIEEWVEVDPEYSQRTYEHWADDIYEDGRLPDDESMDTFWEIMVEVGDFEERFDEEEFLDRTYIDSFEEWAP